MASTTLANVCTFDSELLELCNEMEPLFYLNRSCLPPKSITTLFCPPKIALSLDLPNSLQLDIPLYANSMQKWTCVCLIVANHCYSSVDVAMTDVDYLDMLVDTEDCAIPCFFLPLRVHFVGRRFKVIVKIGLSFSLQLLSYLELCRVVQSTSRVH